MKHVLLILSGSLIAILGFTSCSSDTPPDTWHLNEPHIEDPSQPGRNVSLSETPVGVEATESELVFDNSDLKGVNFHIQAHCVAPVEFGGEGSKSADVDFDFRGTPRISLGGLWPAEFWKTLSESELEKSACAMTFTAVNEHGSTHRFFIPALRLRHFESMSESPAIASFATTEKLPFAIDTSNGPTTVSLVCDGESVDSSLSSGESVASLFSRLMAATLKVHPEKPVAVCRVLSWRTNTEAPPRYKRSQPFQLELSPPTVKVTSAVQVSHMLSDAIQFRVLVTTIANSSPYAIAVRVANETGVFHVSPVMMNETWLARHEGNPFFLHPALSLTTSLSITGAVREWREQGVHVIEIGPGHSVDIAMQIASAPDCLRGRIIGRVDPRGAEVVGAFYGFENQPSFELIRGWESATPHLLNEGVSLSLTSIPTWSGAIGADSFQPSPSYLAAFDRSGRAPTRAEIDRDLSRSIEGCQ